MRKIKEFQIIGMMWNISYLIFRCMILICTQKYLNKKNKVRKKSAGIIADFYDRASRAWVFNVT